MAVLLDVNKFELLYRHTAQGDGLSGSVVYLKLLPVKPGRVRVLTHVTVENRTTDYTKCRLGISRGALLYYLDELQDIEANELAVSRSDILLGEGDYFFAELTGTTTGDVLVMTCAGWEQGI